MPYCHSRLALPTRECLQFAILRTNRNIRPEKCRRRSTGLLVRIQGNTTLTTNRNTLLATIHMHFSVLACFLLRWRSIWILEHNIDWRVLLATFAFPTSFSRTEASIPFLSYLFHARKAGDAACDKPLSPKTLSCSLADRRCPWAKKRLRGGGKLAAFWFFLISFLRFGRNSVDARDLRFLSLGDCGKAGSLPSIPGTSIRELGFGFWDGWMHTLFTSGHWLLRILGLGVSGFLFWERSPPCLS